MSESEKRAIAELKKELTRLTAENLAMQFVFNCMLNRVIQQNPSIREIALQAFDDAANHAENFSIRAGIKAGHLPETLRIIEQMRLMLVGEDKPTREV